MFASEVTWSPGLPAGGTRAVSTLSSGLDFLERSRLSRAGGAGGGGVQLLVKR